MGRGPAWRTVFPGIWVTSPSIWLHRRRACPRAAAVETEVRPEERREPRTVRDGGGRGVAGEGLSGLEGPPSYWAEGDTTYTRQVDIWDEGREPAHPTLILFAGWLPSSVPSALRSNRGKVVRVQGAGLGRGTQAVESGVECGMWTGDLEASLPLGEGVGSSAPPPL